MKTKSIFTLLFLSLSILYIPLLNYPSVTPKWIAWAIFPAILIIFAKKNDELTFSKSSAFFSAYFIWTIFSYIWATSKIASVEPILYALVALLSYFPIKIYLKNHKNLFEEISSLLIISSLIISITGILQYFGFITHLFNQRAVPASMFVNKNFAAPYTVFAFWWLWFYYMKTGKKILIPVLAFDIFYLIISATRSAWIAFIITFAIFFIIYIKSKLKIPLKAVLTFLSILFLLIILSRFKPKEVKVQRDFLAQADSIITVNKSVQVRINRWKNSKAIFLSKPIIGYGAGNYEVVYPIFHNAETKDKFYSTKFFLGGAHNEFIQILCEKGIIGLILFLLLVWYLFKNAYFLQNKFLSFSIILSSLSLLITSFFSSTLHYPTYLFLFILNYAIADTYNTDSVYRISLKSLKLIYLTIFLIFIVLSYKIFQSDRYFKKANSEFYKGNITYAWKYSLKAISYWKYNNFLLFNASNYGYTLSLYDKRIIPKLKQINNLALKALPYHFLPNFSKGLILYNQNNKKAIKEYLKNQSLILSITPDNRVSDIKKLFKSLKEKL